MPGSSPPTFLQSNRYCLENGFATELVTGDCLWPENIQCRSEALSLKNFYLSFSSSDLLPDLRWIQMPKKDVAVEDPDISVNANVNPSGFRYWRRLIFLLNSAVDFSLTVTIRHDLTHFLAPSSSRKKNSWAEVYLLISPYSSHLSGLCYPMLKTEHSWTDV